MKKVIHLYVSLPLFSILLLLSFVGESQTIGNPGFESGSSSPWSLNSSRVVSNNAHSGTYAIYETGEANIQQVITNLQPNKTYTLEGWMKVVGASSVAEMGVKSTTTGALIKFVDTRSTDYAKYDVTFTTDSATTQVTVYFYNAPGGSAYGDDFSLLPFNDQIDYSVHGDGSQFVVSYQRSSRAIESLTPALYDHLTHIILLAESEHYTIAGDGSIVPGDELKKIMQTAITRKGTRKTKMILGFSGVDSVYTPIIQNQAKMNNYLLSFKNLCVTYGFDGGDIDWENPETSQELALSRTFSEAMYNTFKASGLWVSQAVAYYNTADMRTILPYVDYINAMTYDDFDANNYLSPYSHFPVMIDAILSSGIPASKVLAGLPFYGYYAESDWALKGAMPYSAILDVFHPAIGADVAARPNGQSPMTFNGTVTIWKKSAYALQKNLKGVMIFESYMDYPDYSSDSSLMYQVNSVFPVNNASSNIVSLYNDCYYGGGETGITQAGGYTQGQLEALGFTNDQVSSLRIAGGYTAVLYADNNFSGPSLTLTANNYCLIDSGFNDRVSSIRVVRLPDSLVTLYGDCNYGGWAAAIGIPGSYTQPELEALGFYNDDASSIKVADGYAAILYANNNFAGSSFTVTADNKCLIDSNFNDAVSSLKIIRVASSSGNAATSSKQSHEALDVNQLSNDPVKEAAIGEIYPNPLSGNVLNIPCDFPEDQTITMSLVDVYGKVLKKQTKEVTGGATTISFNAGALKPGIYMLNVIGSGGKISNTCKFVKL